MSRPTVAVIGAGVSGLTAAHALRATHDVTLFESDDRLGGHAHTHDVRDSAGTVHSIDSGFIVHNARTYPHLLALFEELGVQTQETEMSMSIACDGCGLTWAGGKGLTGILAQPHRVLSPSFVRMLREIPRFHAAARALLATPVGDHDPTWGEFLAAGSWSTPFVHHYALPLVACVWSSGDDDARSYPARHLFTFLEHHGMLSVKGSPTWRTVVGGSRSYVQALVERLPDVRSGTAATAVTRHPDGVQVRTAHDLLRFDQVVLATHADQALHLLADATPEEKADLGAIRYSRNETWLHRDASILPRSTRARASWNHRTDCTRSAEQVTVSYSMNRLHRIDSVDEHVVTLNAPGLVDPDLRIAAMTYEHPIFTPQAVAAAARLREAGGPRLAFAGAHLGWGFHEDGCRSGVEAAHRLGGTWGRGR